MVCTGAAGAGNTADAVQHGGGPPAKITNPAKRLAGFAFAQTQFSLGQVSDFQTG